MLGINTAQGRTAKNPQHVIIKERKRGKKEREEKQEESTFTDRKRR